MNAVVTLSEGTVEPCELYLLICCGGLPLVSNLSAYHLLAVCLPPWFMCQDRGEKSKSKNNLWVKIKTVY